MIFDLIAGMNAGGGAAVWTPADLFKSGEEGFWLDGSDYSTMSQSRTAQVDVTAAGQAVGQWRNKIAGQTKFVKFVAAADAVRPLTKTTSGKLAVVYDGVDDQLISPNTGTVTGRALSVFLGQKTGAVSAGKSVYAGVNSEVNIQNQANQTVLMEALSASLTSTELYSITTPNVLGLFGSANSGTTVPLTIRVNGVSKVGGALGSTSNIGTSIKIVGTATLYSEISQVVFINRVLTTEEITLLEAYIGSKQ